jgi:hypothetical protein
MTAALLAAMMAALIEVPPGGSIQTALDQASAGDTVLLLPGTHAGSGTHLAEITGAHDGVTLLGDPQSPESVILDGAGLSECIMTVDGTVAGEVGPSTVIRGLTFSGGSSGASPFGGGMRLEHASPLIDLCVFDDCSADNGAGAYVWKGQPRFSGCGFYGCYTVSAGAGLYLYDSDALVEGCRFEGCSSNDDGAGVYLYHSDASIHNCLFLDGDAGDDGAAIYCYTLSFPDVGFCTFSGGVTGGNGAAVYFRVQCGGYIHDNIVTENSDTGFWEKGGATPTFSHNCVWENSGGSYGNLPDPTGQDGNIEADPLITGDWYLSCTSAGQPEQSPCIDAGSAAAEDAGLSMYWTRTDSVADAGTADIGFHHGPPPEWTGASQPDAPGTGLRVFPCPAAGAVTVISGEAAGTVRILDLAGRQVLSREGCGRQTVIPLPGELPPGVYLVTAGAGGASAAAPVVVMQR